MYFVLVVHADTNYAQNFIFIHRKPFLLPSHFHIYTHITFYNLVLEWASIKESKATIIPKIW
jgi:hypothetical protein